MPEPGEVLIVGAGPAGSATALRLARLGHRVCLVDRERFPRDKPCAEYLTPATLRQLDALQVAHLLPALPDAAIEATAVVTHAGHRLTGQLGSPTGQPGRAVPRRILDAALVRAAVAAGVRLETARVVDLLHTSDGAVGGAMLEREDGVRVAERAGVTVGADGLRSIVARRTGMRRQGRLRRLAFSGHLRGVDALTSTTEMHVGASGYVGINRLGEDLANVSLVVPHARASEVRGDPAAFFRRALDAFPQVQERMRHATVVREILTTGPFDVSCRRAAGPGFVLVGDAAEFFDPFTGDGIHSALAGAALAAEAVHRALGAPPHGEAAAWRRYRMQRQQTFGGTHLLERMIGHAMLAPRFFDRAIATMQRRGMGDLLVGATGHEIPAWHVLNPYTLARMLA